MKQQAQKNAHSQLEGWINASGIRREEMLLHQWLSVPLAVVEVVVEKISTTSTNYLM